MQLMQRGGGACVWRIRAVVVLAISLSALPWVACVGEDPGTAAPSGNLGERGQPCNRGSCLSELTCVDNVCVLIEAGVPSNEGGLDGSGSGSDSGDGSTDEGDAAKQEAGV